MNDRGLKDLLDEADISSDEKEDILRSATSGADAAIPSALVKDGESDSQDLRTALAEMKIAQKMKLALLGNGTVRGLLIRDTNRSVQELVLQNPRLTLPEVEEFAKNTNTSDNILRLISNSRDFMKQYSIKLALVTNPKSPSDVAMKWLRYLRTADLRQVARSKSIPQVVAIAARKRLEEGRS